MDKAINIDDIIEMAIKDKFATNIQDQFQFAI